MDFLASCDAISSVSESSKKQFFEIIGNSFDNKKITTHRLPVEPPSSFSIKKINKEPLILFVSTLGYNKNHLCLLDAAETLWMEGLSFELEFVGQSDPSWSHKVIKEINKLKEQKRPIKWLKHISQNDLEERYARCSFTVFPSTNEGFGLPILESLIRGKPCICGKNGALGEISRDGGCLTITDQTDSNLLANAIRLLLMDKKLVIKLEKQAKSRDYGNWENYSANLLAHFFYNS
jgi:glycosyltransferase involved in cell wall biosynthesis